MCLLNLDPSVEGTMVRSAEVSQLDVRIMIEIIALVLSIIAFVIAAVNLRAMWREFKRSKKEAENRRKKHGKSKPRRMPA